MNITSSGHSPISNNKQNVVTFKAHCFGSRNMLSKSALDLWDKGQDELLILQKEIEKLSKKRYGQAKIVKPFECLEIKNNDGSVIRLYENNLTVSTVNSEGDISQLSMAPKGVGGPGVVEFDTPINNRYFYIDKSRKARKEVEDFIKKYIPMFLSEK